MAYKVVIKTLVFADAEDAFTWYNKQIDGLGNRFYHHFLNTLDNIQAKPLTFSYLKEPIRRCRMRSFPYKIYFTVEVFTISILGLAHSKRSNAYIRRRLK
jgi:mRNA-degrading endonuclease RelE of RelBE toxin-antitoxin system